MYSVVLRQCSTTILGMGMGTNVAAKISHFPHLKGILFQIPLWGAVKQRRLRMRHLCLPDLSTHVVTHDDVCTRPSKQHTCMVNTHIVQPCYKLAAHKVRSHVLFSRIRFCCVSFPWVLEEHFRTRIVWKNISNMNC